MWPRQPREGVAERLKVACEQRDAAAIARLLHAEAEVIVDGGTSSCGSGARGAPAGAAALLAVVPEAAVLEAAPVNGSAGITIGVDGRIVGVLALSARRHRIDRVWVVTNPAKLGHWNR